MGRKHTFNLTHFGSLETKGFEGLRSGGEPETARNLYLVKPVFFPMATKGLVINIFLPLLSPPQRTDQNFHVGSSRNIVVEAFF